MRVPYAIQFVFSTGFNLVYRLLPAYLTQFSGSAAQIGLVGSAYSLGKTLRIVLAPLADKHGVEKAVFAALLFMPALAFAAMLADSIAAFIAVFFLVGIVNGIYYTALATLIGQRHERKTEGQFRLEGMNQFGVVAGPLIGGFVALYWGAVFAFAIWAVLALVGVGLAALLIRNRNERTPRKQEKVAWRLLVKPMVFGGFLTGVYLTAMDLAVPIALARAGFDLGSIGVVIGGAAVIGAIGMMWIGRRLEGRSRRGVMSALFLVMGTCMVLFGQTTAFALLIPLVGIAYAVRPGGQLLARANASLEMPKERQASAISVIDTACAIGQIMGPLLAGLAIDLVGTQTAFLAIGAAYLVLAVPALRA